MYGFSSIENYALFVPYDIGINFIRTNTLETKTFLIIVSPFSGKPPNKIFFRVITPALQYVNFIPVMYRITNSNRLPSILETKFPIYHQSKMYIYMFSLVTETMLIMKR